MNRELPIEFKIQNHNLMSANKYKREKKTNEEQIYVINSLDLSLFSYFIVRSIVLIYLC